MSVLDLKLIIKGRGIAMTRRKKGRKGIDEEAECQEDCLEEGSATRGTRATDGTRRVN